MSQSQWLLAAAPAALDLPKDDSPPLHSRALVIFFGGFGAVLMLLVILMHNTGDQAAWGWAAMTLPHAYAGHRAPGGVLVPVRAHRTGVWPFRLHTTKAAMDPQSAAVPPVPPAGGIDLQQFQNPEVAAKALKVFEAELRAYNSHTNVYSKNAYDKLPFHMQDSLQIAERVLSGPVLDLGSGSGLPSFFIAALDPSRPVYAVESKGKKTRMMEGLKEAFGLPQYHILNENVVELCRKWAFDVEFVTAKAFKKLPEVLAIAESCIAHACDLVIPISEAQKAQAQGMGARVVQQGPDYFYFIKPIKPRKKGKAKPPVYEP